MDEILAEMEIYAEKKGIPICGKNKGKFLFLLTKAKRAKKVLELGTAIGYSTLWIAKGLDEKGEIWTIDLDPICLRKAKEYFERAKVAHKIKTILGDARKVLDKISVKFDLIFIDIVKSQYVEVFEKCYELLRKNGILVADNVYWEETRDFLKKVKEHPFLYTLILPIEDGLSVSLKK